MHAQSAVTACRLDRPFHCSLTYEQVKQAMIDVGKFKGDQHLSDAFAIGGVISENDVVRAVPC